MQTLFKSVICNIKFTGLNTNFYVRRFARLGPKQKKSFTDMLTQKKEEIPIIPNEKEIDDKFVAPEDFEHIEASKVEEVVEEFEEDLDADKDLVFQASKEEAIEHESQYAQFDKETKKFIKDELLYPGYDPHPEKLVQRPHKDVVWGLGGQLLKRKTKFFEHGRLPEVEEVIAFLEMEHAKDVDLFDLHELGRTDLPKWGIVLTGYSSRHLFRMGSGLVKCIKELEIPEQVNPPRLDGRRDDDWIMVSFKDYMVHMFTEESREEVDMEGKWTGGIVSDGEEEDEKQLTPKNKRKLYRMYKGE